MTSRVGPGAENDSSGPDPLQRVSAGWGKMAAWTRRQNWLQSPTILRHVNRLTSGDERNSWFDAFLGRHYPPSRYGGEALSIGCNWGPFERQIAAAGVCERMDAYDVSEEAIAIARREAAAANLPIDFHVADCNRLELPERRYSLVLAAMALHHLEALEFVLDQIHDALRDDGFFVFNEFVGPTRFQWTDAQLRVINMLRRELPREMFVTPDGDFSIVERPTIEFMMADDPSESVRSAEIIPLVEERFEIVERRDYGGTVLCMFFHQVIANFDEENPDHVAFIQLLCNVDETMIRAGVLPSDFTSVVARRRS